MIFNGHTGPEPICATTIVISHRSLISFRSVIDPSNWSIKPVIASRDHRAVNVFYGFCCFLCQFYTCLHNAIDLNINLYFYFTFLLFQTDYLSFHITKLLSDYSSIRQLSIRQRSISVSDHGSVKSLHGSVQGLDYCICLSFLFIIWALSNSKSIFYS